MMNRSKNEEKGTVRIESSTLGAVETASMLKVAGIAPIPIKPDGSKAPAIRWKKYQKRMPTPEEMHQWFKQANGVAVVCGAVSGNLEILDFDDAETFPKWRELVEREHKDLLERLTIVETPTRGIHVYYRCPEGVEGNQKLARRKGRDDRQQVLIETRGEGGYAIAPGSPPQCHPANKPYTLIQGALDSIPTISSGERSLLIASARALNEYVEPRRTFGVSKTQSGNRPGDEYNRKASWDEILGPAGWEKAEEREGVGHWKRPGKAEPGISATTNYQDSDLLYVFSTNTDPFESERAYTKFAAYALLNHGGDFKAAAGDLSAQGYGQSPVLQNEYEADPSGLLHLKPTQNGTVPVRLTNFDARIRKDVVEDDGAEQRHVFEIDAELKGRKAVVTIPQSEFASMNWVTQALGAEAIVFAGQGAKDHARVAIQWLSGDIDRREVFTHTGWRKIDGKMVDLHAGGGIGQDGVVDGVEVRLSPALRDFELPEPPDGDELRRAIRSNLDFLDVAPDTVTLPLFAAIFRAVLGATDHNLHLAGLTGTGKSELAALVQRHFGPRMDARNLPANWSSTDNALEALAFLAKDAILVIDDFAPNGSGYDVSRWHAKADRLFRAQGNRS